MSRMPSLTGAITALFVAMIVLSASPPRAAAAATATTFSGQATVLMGQVAGVTLPCLEGPADGRDCRGIVDTGPIPAGATAASYNAALLCYPVPASGCLVTAPDLTGQTLGAKVLGATVVASGNAVDANAFVANFSLALAGQQISADVLHAHAQAKCTNNGAVVSAGAQTSVTINGTTYTVGASQTQTVPLLGALGVNIGFVVINEGASAPRSGSSIDASALHIVINDPVTTKTTDITVAAVHADVTCATPLGCPSDHLFVTGGGFFNNTVANVAKAHFTVAGGKNRPWGHVLYKPTGLHVKDPSAILFFASGSTLSDVITALRANHPEFSRAINDLGARPGGTKIEGGAILLWPSSSSTVSGGPASGEALALDLGEPGRDDYFEIAGASGSSFATLGGGFLDGGNIQMHGKC